MKKTVIKVNINCQICKSDVLKAVAKLTGINEISVDSEKGTLSVVGDVDPILVIDRVRKIGKTADFVSVGPQKPPEPAKPKPPEHEKPTPLPSYCNECQFVVVSDAPYDGRFLCSILCGIL